jgi:serine/alanine adding enzyme
MIGNHNPLPGHRGDLPKQMRVVRSLDVEQWATFVDQHPNGSIFHTPGMHRVFTKTRHCRPAVWATLGGDGEIRALMTPVAIQTLGGPLRAMTSRVVAFGGTLVSRGPCEREALEALLRTYQRASGRTALFTEVRNLAAVDHLAPSLHACGFRHENHLNFLVDLAPSEEQIWRRVAPSARRNVRKARRLGVAIEEVVSPSGIAAGYEVLRHVYHRLRVPLPDRSLFQSAYWILGPLGQFKLLLANLAGRPIGALTLLSYRSVVYYWYTGILREYARYRAGDLLAWHAIQSARAQGYETFDFGGAGRPNEPYGVRDFKAKYGGELVDFGRHVWTPAPLRLRMALVAYAMFRRFL